MWEINELIYSFIENILALANCQGDLPYIKAPESSVYKCRLTSTLLSVGGNVNLYAVVFLLKLGLPLCPLSWMHSL